MASEMCTDLTVAVTGPTGTLGYGLMPLLQADDRVARVTGVARRPFDAAAFGWTKTEYRRGDVRDPEVLRDIGLCRTAALGTHLERCDRRVPGRAVAGRRRRDVRVLLAT